MSRTQVPVDWRNVETILLDMDGTVLDLAFDNHFWLGVVPAAYGESRGLSGERAWSELKPRFDRVAGQLDWYCIDYWSDQLGLDLRALKHAHRYLIGYLPGAVGFLEAARSTGRRLAVVTNAHPGVLEIKLRQTRLDRFVDAIVSSHRIGVAKEDPRFWPKLTEHLDYAHESSLLIDDSTAVASAASAHGIETLLIRCPDSQQARRDVDTTPAVDGLGDLIDALCERPIPPRGGIAEPKGT